MATTRQRILEEAMLQLPEHGYAAFTLASVRQALGISSGSMFHAFPSKPALAAAVFIEGMADYQGYALEAIAEAPTPEAGLRAWVAAHLVWIEDHRALAGLLFASLPREVITEVSGPLSAYNERFNAAIAALFDRARDAGLLAALPRRVAHVLCIAPAHEYGRMWTMGRAELPPREVIPALQEGAIAALRSTLAGGDRSADQPRGARTKRTTKADKSRTAPGAPSAPGAVRAKQTGPGTRKGRKKEARR